MSFPGPANHGASGISSTPGDQRDTGSGYSCLKEIPDCTRSPFPRVDASGTTWDFRFRCSHIIGKGGFATVYLGERWYYGTDGNEWTDGPRREKKKYAIKELKYSSDREKTYKIKRVLYTENQVCDELRRLNEPHNTEINIVKPLSVITDDKYQVGYIITEYCSGGDLEQYLKHQCQGERVKEIQARNIMLQVTKGKSM